LIENKELSFDLWHRKLGHVGNDCLKNLLKISDGIGLSLAEMKEDKKVCKIYMEAKYTRIKYDNTRTKATKPLQIVHTDLCGQLILLPGMEINISSLS